MSFHAHGRNDFQGPVCEATVAMPSKLRTIAALGAGPRVGVRMLIDTGATLTAVSLKVLEQLGLHGNGTIDIHTSNGSATFPTYSIDLEFDSNTVFRDIRVTQLPATALAVHALLGRDIMSFGKFEYDGRGQHWRLDLEPPRTIIGR